MILLDVNNKTLLLSQRVDRSFAAAVQSSHQIQRKLFFELPLKKTTDSMTRGLATSNHLPLERDITIGIGGSSFHMWKSGHPPCEYATHETSTWYFYFFADPHCRTHKSTGHESWRRMLLRDAAGRTVIEYYCRCCRHRDDHRLPEQDSEDKTVTLGQIVRNLLAHHGLYRCRRCTPEGIERGMIVTGCVVTHHFDVDKLESKIEA